MARVLSSLRTQLQEFLGGIITFDSFEEFIVEYFNGNNMNYYSSSIKDTVSEMKNDLEELFKTIITYEKLDDFFKQNFEIWKRIESAPYIAKIGYFTKLDEKSIKTRYAPYFGSMFIYR